MKNRVVLAVWVALLALATNAKAQEYRFELAPFVGYEMSGSYPIQTSFTTDRLRANGNIFCGTFLD